MERLLLHHVASVSLAQQGPAPFHRVPVRCFLPWLHVPATPSLLPMPSTICGFISLGLYSALHAIFIWFCLKLTHWLIEKQKTVGCGLSEQEGEGCFVVCCMAGHMEKKHLVYSLLGIIYIGTKNITWFVVIDIGCFSAIYSLPYSAQGLFSECNKGFSFLLKSARRCQEPLIHYLSYELFTETRGLQWCLL